MVFMYLIDRSIFIFSTGTEQKKFPLLIISVLDKRYCTKPNYRDWNPNCVYHSKKIAHKEGLLTGKELALNFFPEVNVKVQQTNALLSIKVFNPWHRSVETLYKLTGLLVEISGDRYETVRSKTKFALTFFA